MRNRPLALTLFFDATRPDAASILQRGLDGVEEEFDAYKLTGGLILYDVPPIESVDRAVLAVHFPDRSAVAEHEVDGLACRLWFVPLRLIQQIAVITLATTDDMLPHHGEGPSALAGAPPVEP